MSEKKTDAEQEANKTIEKIKDYAQWIILAILFIVVGWPLIVEFT